MSKKILTAPAVRTFQKKITSYYKKYGRNLPWRKTKNPYRILISEIMLQQTQVDRVCEKYKEFLAVFPDFHSLAHATPGAVLRVWSGLGYNRRALALRSLAQKVMESYSGKLPCDPQTLIALPGIGNYTAGAICAFAFNMPVLCMDTNIRRVFIHEFFQDKKNVKDQDILPLLEQTLYKENPRLWYNALMDYGSMLKQTSENPNKKSAHYARQSPFANSNRQVRGAILKVLVKESPLSAAQIAKKTKIDPERVTNNLVRLCDEGFIQKKKNTFHL
ncbi:MAG: winged helix-turn-helix transcriptional regulator [Nitrospirota bacterium]